MGRVTNPRCLISRFRKLGGVRIESKSASLSDRMSSVVFKADNGNDHRAGTENLNIEKDAQARLRVHRIVIRRMFVMI
jgi:hypothetical protein